MPPILFQPCFTLVQPFLGTRDHSDPIVAIYRASKKKRGLVKWGVWGPLKACCAFPYFLAHLYRIQGYASEYRECFFVSLQCTLHPLQAIQLKPEYIWDSMLIYMSSYCKVCRQCRVHCKDTKTFPVVPRHTPVSYISWLNSMARHNKLFKPPKTPHFTQPRFFLDAR